VTNEAKDEPLKETKKRKSSINIEPAFPNKKPSNMTQKSKNPTNLTNKTKDQMNVVSMSQDHDYFDQPGSKNAFSSNKQNMGEIEDIKFCYVHPAKRMKSGRTSKRQDDEEVEESDEIDQKEN
jgi:hypothetical protein